MGEEFKLARDLSGQPDRRAGQRAWVVYVLWFLKDSSRYTGQTQNFTKRIKQHLLGRNYYTSRKGLFKLIYTEIFYSQNDALEREKFLKSRRGRKYLDKLLRP